MKITRPAVLIFFPLCLIPAILIASLFLQCRISENPATSSDPADLLPIDNDISGFVRKGNPQIMTDQSSIYATIDGQAELYIDYGFTDGVKQLFSNGNIDIDAQLFNQGNEKNAEGLFERFYPSSPELISQKNPRVVIDQADTRSSTRGRTFFSG
jgi:hypothetical protein